MKKTIACIHSLALVATLVALGSSTAIAADSDCPSGQECNRSELFIALPDYVNTADGMVLMKDDSIIVSAPNFNDETKPPLLVRITGNAGNAKAEKFYEFPNPYPGLPEGSNRISPMGIAQAPNGDIFIADMQIRSDMNQKSRLWRLVMKDRKPQKMVLVAKNFNVANGLVVHNGYIYVTESVLEPGANPLPSAVLRFKLTEENVALSTPLKNDPHIIATFTSKKTQWGFGADGIDFDDKGNLYVGLFGEGQVFKISFDKKGNVVSNTLLAEAPGRLISCDGMRFDKRTNKLYLADAAANTIWTIDAINGAVEKLAFNGDVTDTEKQTGLLDQPVETLVRGNEIIVSNMDWPFPNFKNTKWQMPVTLSIIMLIK